MSLGSYPSLRQEHQIARADFVAAARRVDAVRWNTSSRAGHWSPAQIAEHLRLSYVVLGGELQGRPGLRVRTNWWQRALIRWKFLGAILHRGTIPPGARAPRELLPGPGPFDREPVLEALEHAALDFEAMIEGRWNEPGSSVTHHIFGGLKPDEALRFGAVHLRHHMAQLPSSGS